MNRIAIIYSGHLRTWDRCKQNHQVRLWTQDCDFYFHTYEDPCFHLYHRWTKIPEQYHELYGHRYNARKRGETVVASTLNQWHNNFVAWSLVPKHYDIYVRVRPDIDIDETVHLKNYLEEDPGKIFIPKGEDYGGINDQFAFGGYIAMKAYYEVYLNHFELWHSGVEFHSEGIQLANLKNQGIVIERLPYTNKIRR